MKRHIISILIAVLVGMPLLSIQASAENLEMKDVVGDTRLPVGYVYPKWSGMHSENSFGKNQLFFYDTDNSIYLGIFFNGSVTFFNSFDVGWNLRFSNPESLEIRAYPCNGRDVFSFTRDDLMSVYFPAYEFRRNGSSGQDAWVSNSCPEEIRVFVNKSQPIYSYPNPILPNNSIVDVYTDGKAYYVNYRDYPQYKQEVSRVALEWILKTVGATMELDDFTSKNIDYYIVQNSFSTVKTSIDYDKTYSISNGFLKIDGGYICRGLPVSFYVFNWSNTSFLFESGAYYLVHSLNRTITLHNYEKNPIANGLGVDIEIINKFLTHFNYEPIFYSSDNTVLSSDIGGIGDTMGGFADKAGDFENQAGNAVSGVTAAVGSFTPFFNLVLGIIPPWVWALMSVSLTFVVGRKILGR